MTLLILTTTMTASAGPDAEYSWLDITLEPFEKTWAVGPGTGESLLADVLYLKASAACQAAHGPGSRGKVNTNACDISCTARGTGSVCRVGRCKAGCRVAVEIEKPPEPQKQCLDSLGRTKLAAALPLAHLSQHVYTCGADAACPDGPGGWKRVKTWKELVPHHTDEPEGFNAAVFERAGKHVLVFQGSEKELADWDTNLRNELGNPTLQYGLAELVGREAATLFPGLTVTGHSLGGGLAQVAGRAADAETVVFNAASPFGGASTDEDRAWANAKATLIAVDGDFINDARRAGLTGEGYAPTCTLDGVCTTGVNIRTGAALYCDVIDKHDIDTVIGLIQQSVISTD